MKAIKKYSILILMISLFRCGGDNPEEPDVNSNLFYLSFYPQTIELEAMASGTFDIIINSVEDLFAVSFDLICDTTVVRIDSITVPSASIMNDSALCLFNNIPGGSGVSVFVGHMQTESNDNVSGNGILVEIHFTCLTANETTLEFQDVDIRDEDNNINTDLENLELRTATVN